eukprot:CAMPEP_0177788544 /NCGR_PEP_ID=MMETSP0491_2-20121128/22193_1 /TAXON_ID=63592 /ORGANISM="Tetraselmis chuii, Strain PLY429" /LENGTH=91 /DNA_ID=CAMNT_0019310189 /DNA_START=156 /DNA_END=428 /DNA_ORIENTATION=+
MTVVVYTEDRPDDGDGDASLNHDKRGSGIGPGARRWLCCGDSAPDAQKPAVGIRRKDTYVDRQGKVWVKQPWYRTPLLSFNYNRFKLSSDF